VEDELSVWLYGARVAVIGRERDRLRLTYSEEALTTYPLGTPLLSLSLPVSSRRYTHGVVRPFLDGLLPEGTSRRAIAYDLHVNASDTYGLIRLLGRDCAGAMVIQPSGDLAPPLASTTTAEPLSTEDINELVRNLKSAPLGVGGRVRISLAGVQDKLVLTRMRDGNWGRPVDATPSTHILKPEIAAFPDTVQNEAFCMRVAKHLGLNVASVDTTQIGGRALLVVERYDRVIGADGTVRRIHQEDFCQATGVAPEQKYQEDGGPSLSRIAGILRDLGPPGSLERLLEAVTLNVLIGNGDAHGKNFSLLHADHGALTLAPLYDLMCTLYYGDDRLAMYIDTVHQTNQVTAARIVNEATQWGMSQKRATDVVVELLKKVPAALGLARDETPGVPAKLVAVIKRQLKQLQSSQ
jgi:serine/threonine-protein kinase HipA